MILLNRIVTILSALLLDQIIKDPPNAFHPVGWMGKFISLIGNRTLRGNNLFKLVYGCLILCLGIALFGMAGRGLQWVIDLLSAPFNWLIGAFLLNFFFTVRGLKRATDAVQQALDDGDLDKARWAVGYHMVSRDTGGLNASQISAAAVESVAENTNDSIIAPLLYYLVGGLAGVLIYRFVNTADSMLGYHDEEREWLGKIPAILDDVLNFIPARITALLMIMVSLHKQFNFKNAWRIWYRDRYKTTSPNAGHPMSAAAGALDLELAKSGVYVLGQGSRRANHQDIERSVKLMQLATASLTGMLLICTVFIIVD